MKKRKNLSTFKLVGAFGSHSQINSFLYACVSAPPSSPQHSGAGALFLLLKPCCWWRPLALADVASVALVMMAAGEFGLGALTSRLSANVNEASRKERRKPRVCAALLNEGEGKERERRERVQSLSVHGLIFHALSPSYTV